MKQDRSSIRSFQHSHVPDHVVVVAVHMNQEVMKRRMRIKTTMFIGSTTPTMFASRWL